jgi:hypothetical protein
MDDEKIELEDLVYSYPKSKDVNIQQKKNLMN